MRDIRRFDLTVRSYLRRNIDKCVLFIPKEKG